MAGRFSVNKADPKASASVFVSADDVRDGDGSSSPQSTVDSPSRLSVPTGSDRPTSSPDEPAATAVTSADDQAPGNALSKTISDFLS